MVDGGGCCPTMDLLRSEPMQLVQLIIPVESAHRTVSYLGDLGLFQFKDVSIKQTHLIHMNIKCTHIRTSFIYSYLWFFFNQCFGYKICCVDFFIICIGYKFAVCFMAEGWSGYEFKSTLVMHYKFDCNYSFLTLLDIGIFAIPERLTLIWDFALPMWSIGLL